MGSKATLPVSPVPLWRPIEARPEDYFSPEEIARSKSYQRPLQRARLLSTLLGAATLAAITAWHVGPEIAEEADGFSWPVVLLFEIVLVVVATTLVPMPVVVWREFVHEKRWGFSTQTGRRFVADQVKETLLAVVLTFALFLPLWALMRATDLWWVFGAAVFVLFFVVLRWLAPLVILPLFNKFTPLGDDALRARLASLAERAGVRLSGYEVMDASKRTTKDNAFFAGMGGTRKVVLFDNLLQLPPARVEIVVGHELGHWRRGHDRRFLAVGFLTHVVLFALLALFMEWDAALEWARVTGPGDPGAFPVFALVFGAGFFVTRLLDQWLSRWCEREADLDALELTSDPDSYVDLWRSFTDRNLPDLDPSWADRIRRSHPPIAERIAFADAWSRSRSG